MNPDLKWSPGSRQIEIGSRSVDLPGEISRVLPWEEKALVVVIVESPELLLVLDHDGQLVHAFPPPEGFRFYYIARHADYGVSVICESSTPVENWYDWQFRIDLQRKTLVRFSPSK